MVVRLTKPVEIQAIAEALALVGGNRLAASKLTGIDYARLNYLVNYQPALARWRNGKLGRPRGLKNPLWLKEPIPPPMTLRGLCFDLRNRRLELNGRPFAELLGIPQESLDRLRHQQHGPRTANR